MDINEVFNSTKSKKNFLKGLISIIEIDGIDDREKQFFEQAGIALQLDQEGLDEINTFWNDNNFNIEFDNKKQSLLFLREAIQLCYIDHGYSDIERAKIFHLAETLNIPVDMVKKIEDWVEEGIEWSKKGEILINMEA